MDVREKLLIENPWELMISLSLPAILGQLIVGLYAFVDSIYVGQMVGTDAMSAVSAASPFVMINNASTAWYRLRLSAFQSNRKEK